MSLRLDRRFEGLLIAIALTVALGPTAPATAAGTSPARAGSTPTFPVPASARPHPTTSPSPSSTTTPSSSSTPTAAGRPAITPESALHAPARTRARPKSSGKLSTAAIVVAAIAALLALGCAAWGLARRRAFEPHWLLSLRHAMAEAGFRTSATWAEFADWARLGR